MNGINISNAAFQLLEIDKVKIYAKALPMSEAVIWAEEANEIRAKFANLAADFGQMLAVCEDIHTLVASYPSLYLDRQGKTQAPVESMAKAVTGQMLSGLEMLLDVNDPFVWRQRQRDTLAAKEAAQADKILDRLPPEEVARLVEMNLKTQLSASVNDSE